MPKKNYNPVQALENEVKIWTGKCVTNSTSDPDGLSGNITSVTRTAAGKFTVVNRDKFPQCLYAGPPSLIGTAGYEAHVTSVDEDSNGSVIGFKFETWTSGVVAAASGTITCDTKAATTQADYILLNDGQQKYGFELDVAGTGATRATTGVAATGVLECDTLLNSTALDYFVLNDGSNKAMLWYNVAGTDAAKYSKLGSAAATTVTFPTFNDLTNEDYFTVWDGHRNWKIMMDTDASGDSTGTADLIVDVSAGAGYGAGSTAAQMATATHDIIMETTSIPGYTEAIHLTSTDNADGTLTLTCDLPGYAGNGANTENFTHASGLITAAAGGTDTYPAEEFVECDISGATTAADVAAIVDTAIGTFTECKISSTDNTDGTLTLTNDVKGPQGNASQEYLETGSTLMDLDDMSGGTLPVMADVWTNVDISGATTAADIAVLLDVAINGTNIQITSTDNLDDTISLANDNTGAGGNTQQYEFASGAWAVTDMTGGSSGAVAAGDTTDYDVYFHFVMRDSKLTHR